MSATRTVCLVVGSLFGVILVLFTLFRSYQLYCYKKTLMSTSVSPLNVKRVYHHDRSESSTPQSAREYEDIEVNYSDWSAE